MIPLQIATNIDFSHGFKVVRSGLRNHPQQDKLGPNDGPRWYLRKGDLPQWLSSSKLRCVVRAIGPLVLVQGKWETLNHLTADPNHHFRGTLDHGWGTNPKSVMSVGHPDDCFVNLKRFPPAKNIVARNNQYRTLEPTRGSLFEDNGLPGSSSQVSYEEV